jgi:hypothetical protein
MDSQQKSTEVIKTITVSYFADIYLDEDWNDMRWDIVDAIAQIPPVETAPATKTVAFVLEGADQNYYFGTTLVYETIDDVVIYDIFEMDVDLFLDYVHDGNWIQPYPLDC